tara:strand:+ start:8143 stop:8751 length:609 start_codon:yes stop_codon:yes gene_type:complete
MISLSRREFCEKYDLSPGTLQNWEKARFGGLTEKGASKMIDHFRQEGVYCTFKWLMYGEGDDARLIDSDINIPPKNDDRAIRNTSLHGDLNAMNALHPNSVTMNINDDAMFPLLEKGCYVMGNKYFGEDIRRCLNQVCIVETSEGIRYVRLLKRSHVEGAYNLFVYNARTTVHPSSIFDINLVMAAPIFWVRKPEKSYKAKN